MTNIICKFTFLLNLPPTILEWPASFFGLFLPSLYKGQFANQQLVSQSGHQRNGLWKRGIDRRNPKLAIDFFVGRGGPHTCRCLFKLDACGLLHKYRDALQMLAGLMCFLRNCTVHCGKGRKGMAAAVGRSLLWSAWLATDAQVEAKA